MNKLFVVIVAAVAMALGAFIYYKASLPEFPEHALFYESPRLVQPFELIDHNGEPFKNEQLAGKWSWVFFGYTSCPDVCPTTLQELNFVYPEMKTVADNTQVLLVSVDPLRDSVQKLAQYIDYFNPEFYALRAEHGHLFPFARNLGLMYSMVEQTDKEHYLVDHSASIVLINPDGNISAIFKPKHEIGQIPAVDGNLLLADFKRIVALTPF